VNPGRLFSEWLRGVVVGALLGLAHWIPASLISFVTGWNLQAGPGRLIFAGILWFLFGLLFVGTAEDRWPAAVALGGGGALFGLVAAWAGWVGAGVMIGVVLGICFLVAALRRR